MSSTPVTLRRVASAALVLFATALPPSAARGDEPALPKREWRTLASALVHGDSVVVRGMLVRRSVADGDSTFESYRVEGRGGQVWASGSLPGFEQGVGDGPDQGGCDLEGRLAETRGGFVATLDAGCWPSYPDIQAIYRYVVVSDRTVACSEWTDVEWRPERGDTACGWLADGCVSCEIPLAAHVEGDTVMFLLRRPRGVPAVADYWVPATTSPCFIQDRDEPVREIEVFTRAHSKTPVRVRLNLWEYGTVFEVQSALVRVTGSSYESLSVEALRLQVAWDGKRVFIDPATLERIGLQSP